MHMRDWNWEAAGEVMKWEMGFSTEEEQLPYKLISVNPVKCTLLSAGLYLLNYSVGEVGEMRSNDHSMHVEANGGSADTCLTITVL